MAEPARRPGRPRDTSIDERALAATRELLVERGFDATTIQAVATHSGVHASAIYRRWGSRIELIEEATFPGLSPPSVQPTGDLRRDIRRFVRAYLAAFSAPASRAAAAGLLAHHQASSRPRPPDLYLRVSARPQFQDILRAAPPGSIDPDVDPDDVFDMLLGAILARTLLSAATARSRPVERTVEMIIRLLQPRPGHAADQASPYTQTQTNHGTAGRG
ncbi:Regulatory protein TetR [Frankia sp. Hr75.2]|nr:Regulatory protein TetR [Frankia sp. Hr75.2]